MIDTCPKCGATAVLLQARDSYLEVPDLADPAATRKVRVKIEEFKCQEQSCEHEFEKVIQESGE